MLGLFGFLVADKVPGALPTLSGFARQYDGQPMNPFQTEWGTPFAMTVANDAAAGGSALAAAVVGNIAPSVDAL
jgi:hypothetical protein